MGWKAPERVILPVGNGTLLLGVYNGFKDLLKAGIIGFLPKIIGIQAENCKPLVSAWEQGLSKPVPIVLQPTVAEGIAISQPVLGVRILRAISETEGFLLAVPEEDILTNWREMATKGFFMELTSATTFAGIKKFFKENPEELKGKTLSVITGHGLKSVGHF
jgi:threonine synthase